MAEIIKPIEIVKRKLLIVEGREDELLFEALVKHLGVGTVQILPIGGKQELRPNLKMLLLSPGFPSVTSLAIIRDADENPHSAFQSVCNALRLVNLGVPLHPLVPTGGNPEVTVVILPEGNTSGALEDVCLKSVQQDPAIVCVERFFQCLEGLGTALPRNKSKAKVQAFLASRPEPGKRLGEAAQAGYWLWDDMAFEEVRFFLVNFVRNKGGV